MRIHGQTELDRLDALPTETRKRLQALWIDSVEGYLGLLGALEASRSASGFLGAAASNPTRNLALSLVDPELGKELSRGKRGGALGCDIEPEVFERFRAQRRLAPRRETVPLGLEGARLPTAVRLFDQISQVRDQGERGTCVAFATVALREFLARDKSRLSEQFLYWACKELDGHDAPGTSLHTAMTVLSQYGCCLAEKWPYNPSQIDNNESQGPPPDSAISTARRYILLDCRPVEPNLVTHYKRVLAGHGGLPPMPVVMGILVFNSWFMSRAVHRNGKITLPLPDEEPVGGHAMCAVGYVDDPDVPGGGYFIVRNSWGPTWAGHSPEAPGHALVPYEYIEMCAVDAFTGPTQESDQQLASPALELAAYLRDLDKPAPDQSAPNGNGALLRAGTRVLFNPIAPDEIMRDTPENRVKFEQLDRAWTVRTRQQVWFPPVDSLTTAFRDRLDAARANRDRFLSAIEENLRRAEGTPFPRLHVSKWAAFVPYEWEPKIQQVNLAADLSAKLAAELQRHMGVRADLPWPDEWTERIAGVTALKVFRVSGLAGLCHVVAAFLTPIQFARAGNPQFAVVTQQMLEAVHEVYENWNSEAAHGRPCAAFFTLAVEGDLPDYLHVPASGTHWDMLVAFRPDGAWTVPPPRQEIERLSMRDFLDRLKPETLEQRVSRIRKCLDEQLENFRGNVSETRVKQLLGCRRSQVREGFFILQARHPDLYRLKLIANDELAVERPKPGEGIAITAPASIRRAVRKHALGLISLAVGATLAVGSAKLREHLGWAWLSFSTGILIAYFGQVLQKEINQRAERGRD